MIGGWLSGRMQERAQAAGAKEVARFVAGLRGMGDRNLGALLAIATVVRVNMETHGVLPEGLFQRDDLAPSQELGLLQVRLNGVSRQLAKARQGDDATAVMVWSYSLRCLNLPGLEPLGRELWAELRRGFPHVEEMLAEGEKRNGKPFDPRVRAEWRLIPPGLDPGAPVDGDG